MHGETFTSRQVARRDTHFHSAPPRRRSSPTARRTLNSTALALVIGLFGAAAQGADYAAARRAMVDLITDEVRETSGYLGRDALDPRVLNALGTVPRHAFVPSDRRAQAYRNRPLPIGYGQTISQPYIVAVMTDLLDLKPDHKVLEIGTGSGYQAAILAALVDAVYSIEIIPPLAGSARSALEQNGFVNAVVKQGDGYYGWQEHAPFDAIIVTAAASHVPPPLVRQLKPGGRMMIPVGSRFLVQQLVLVKKADDGMVTTEQILPVSFVPLTGGHN